MEQISKSPQVQGESGPADTLTSDFYLQCYKGINVCRLSRLLCGVLLWQPQGTHTPLRWELGYKTPHSWVPKVMNWTRRSPRKGFRLPREMSAPFPSSLSLLPPAKAKTRYYELQWTTLEKYIRMIRITANSNTQCQWRWRVSHVPSLEPKSVNLLTSWKKVILHKIKFTWT